MLVTGALWCSYPLLPAGPWRDTGYDLFAVLCLVIGVRGALTLPGPVRRGWLLVLAGFGGWVLGDVQLSVEDHVLHLDTSPVPSDAVYLLSYVVLALGLARMVRGRQNRSDPTPLLDAAIVAVGFGVVVGSFLIAPVATDSTLSVLGRVVTSAYPIGDVLLLGVLVRLWTTVGARTPAFRLLVLALGSTMVADLAWNVLTLSESAPVSPAPLDLLWLLGYLAAALAACSPSAAALGGDGARAEVGTSAPRRLAALGAALLLPGLTVLALGLLHRPVPWALTAVGSVVLSFLALTRIGLLLRTVEVQAVQLSALARSDALTGAPNRRTWDHELGRAVQHADDVGGPLSVALIDLDHFKHYNDEHGHQAGDLLLREAVAAWTALLEPGELLARYGGEEFGVLLPACDVDEAARRLRAMQERTPRGQRFSAGIAAWTPGTEPSSLVEMADRALYDAKHAGRGRSHVAQTPAHVASSPVVQIALQPIVELGDGSPVGHEALSRFADGPPEAVFAQAHRAGYGPALEAAAIRAAFLERPREGYLSINVSAGALATDAVRSALPADLHGIVIEITEQTDTDGWDEVAAVIADCRARGALIAVDDWGRGYSNVERVLRLRPEVVKLDRSLLTGLDETGRQEALRTLVGWARSMGAQVCAEGVESPAQWATLRELGIQLGQGYLFGRPTVASAPATPEGSVAGAAARVDGTATGGAAVDELHPA